MEEQVQATNVKESWAIYDTICICPTFYGPETSVRGWFTAFNQMATQSEHKFFKVRTEATAGLAYCNQQSSDSMDFPFLCYTAGLTIFGPSPNICGLPGGPEGVTRLTAVDPGAAHTLCYDLPEHISISFKTNQDTRFELTGYACPPGYGPTGGGAAFQITAAGLGVPMYGQHAQMNSFGTQGVPILTNRFKLPSPIEIAKNSVIEGTLYLSEYARYLLANIFGPSNYAFQQIGGGIGDPSLFPQRYGFQMSLFGMRLVQQRGQYHAV
jgi:hypothetical protein